MPEHMRRGNATKSKVCAVVEHVFADQKHRMGVKVRTIGLARAKTKIGIANIAYNTPLRLSPPTGRSARMTRAPTQPQLRSERRQHQAVTGQHAPPNPSRRNQPRKSAVLGDVQASSRTFPSSTRTSTTTARSPATASLSITSDNATSDPPATS